MFSDLIREANNKEVPFYISFNGKTFVLPRKMERDMFSEVAQSANLRRLDDVGFVLKDSLLSLIKNFGQQIMCDVKAIPVLTKEDYPNTRINYLYRDASNYKVHNHVVIRGQMTAEMTAACMAACDEGSYFVPSQIGLPEEKFEAETEDDVPWFELNEFSFSPTLDSPMEGDMTAEQLVENFKAAAGHWNI